jgi:hypothetical protein
MFNAFQKLKSIFPPCLLLGRLSGWDSPTPHRTDHKCSQWGGGRRFYSEELRGDSVFDALEDLDVWAKLVHSVSRPVLRLCVYGFGGLVSHILEEWF